MWLTKKLMVAIDFHMTVNIYCQFKLLQNMNYINLGSIIMAPQQNTSLKTTSHRYGEKWIFR